MNEIIGILGPCLLFIFGFSVMGYLSIRDRRERLQDRQKLQRLQSQESAAVEHVGLTLLSQQAQAQTQNALPRR